MGRPRQHDERTAEALLDAAEQLLEVEGAEALSLRRIAVLAGTTTRAVYSVFGSRDGLEVALGIRAFDMLGAAVQALPVTSSPSRDLVDAGVEGFRAFAIGHPALFRLAVQQQPASLRLAEQFCAASLRALAHLNERVERLDRAGDIAGRSVEQVVREFHALCEGLAALELRGGQLFPQGQEKETWQDALTSLVLGFGIPAETMASA